MIQEQWPMFLYASVLLIWSGYLRGDVVSKRREMQLLRGQLKTQAKRESELDRLSRENVAIGFLMAFSICAFVQLICFGGF